MTQIPNEKNQWVQPNNSDVGGNLYITKGCDFDRNKGRLRLAVRLLLNTSTTDVPEITGAPVGFRVFNNGSDTSVYSVAGAAGVGYVLKALTPGANFVKVVTSGAPATLDSATSDIESAFSELYASSAADAKVYYLNASNAWANFAAGAAGAAMMMCKYGNRVYVTKNGNQIQSFDSSHTVTSPTGATNTNPNSTQIPDSTEYITFMRPASNGLWIGTVNIYGGRGHIYFWNGTDTQITKTYVLDSSGALACAIKNDTPYVTDSNGDILVWIGGAFVRSAGIWKKSKKPLYNSTYYQNMRFIHPNGMAIIDKVVHVLLDLTNNDAASHGGTQEECNPSGIWALDEDLKSLKHKYSFGLSKAGGTILDYGQFKISSAGGLLETIVAANISNGTFMAGCSYFSDATTVLSGIFHDDTFDTEAKGGYLVSPKISAVGLIDIWPKLYAFHEKFLNATDKMIVKFRNIADVPVESTITWTANNGFTSATALTFVKGDDVEILQGVGAGFITRIESITGGNRVRLVDSFTGATGTAIARFGKWRYAGTIQDTDAHDEVPLDEGTWVQVKVAMFWSGANEVSKVLFPGKAAKTAE